MIESTDIFSSTSFGIGVMTVLVLLGVAKILTAIAIYRFLKASEEASRK